MINQTYLGTVSLDQLNMKVRDGKKYLYSCYQSFLLYVVIGVLPGFLLEHFKQHGRGRIYWYGYDTDISHIF